MIKQSATSSNTILDESLIGRKLKPLTRQNFAGSFVGFFSHELPEFKRTLPEVRR